MDKHYRLELLQDERNYLFNELRKVEYEDTDDTIIYKKLEEVEEWIRVLKSSKL